MGVYDVIQDGIHIVQASDNMELLKTFMEIQAGYMEIMKELEEKKERIRKLEEQLENKAKLKLSDKGYYEREGSSTKYCSRCYEVDEKLVSLSVVDDGWTHAKYVCPNCSHEIKKD